MALQLQRVESDSEEVLLATTEEAASGSGRFGQLLAVKRPVVVGLLGLAGVALLVTGFKGTGLSKAQLSSATELHGHDGGDEVYQKSKKRYSNDKLVTALAVENVLDKTKGLEPSCKEFKNLGLGVCRYDSCGCYPPFKNVKAANALAAGDLCKEEEDCIGFAFDGVCTAQLFYSCIGDVDDHRTAGTCGADKINSADEDCVGNYVCYKRITPKVTHEPKKPVNKHPGKKHHVDKKHDEDDY